MKFLLGVDIGTTATKVSVAALNGTTRAELSAPCMVDSPRPGWAQVDTAQWWDNVCTLIPAVLRRAGISADDVLAVGTSGMVPTLIHLDRSGDPLYPSIQQNDARSTVEVRALAERIDRSSVLNRTGSSITIQSIGPKVAWMRQHEPEIVKLTHRICGSYDWIVGKLTGNPTLEANWALESGLWDMTTDSWAEDILEASGVDPKWLSPVGRSHQIVGEVTAPAAAATGLRSGTPVTAGAADHVASAFSAGLISNGDLLIKLGGAGDILLSLDAPLVDERLYLDHHLVPGAWMLNGCMAASGAVIRWFQQELAAGASFQVLDGAASLLPAGSDGIVCLPYFLGEKSPIQDPDARGTFVGLHLGHTQAHLYRAALEGIGYGFRHHLDVFAEHALAVDRVRVTNGGSRSTLWRQIVSNIINRPVESLIDHPGSGLGSAFAAGVAVGAVEWAEIDRFTRVDEVIEPEAEAVGRYDDMYAIYRELYPALAPLSHRLARIQGETE